MSRQTNSKFAVEPPSSSGKHVENQASNVKDEKKVHSKLCPIPGLGIVCALLCTLFFSAMALIVKLVDGQHPVQIALSRACVQFLIVWPFVQYKKDEIDPLGPKGLKIFLWIHGLSGTASVVFLYMAISKLPLGNAITITYINLILVPFMARIFLKEALTFLDIIFAMVSLVGVVLIAQPTFLFPPSEVQQQPTTSGIGVVFALVSAALKSTAIIAIRKLGKRAHPAVNLLYFSACAGVSTTILLSFLNEFQFPCQQDLPLIFTIGVLGVMGQYLMVVAIQYERPGTVSVLRTVQIIIVYALQVAVLGDMPTTPSLIGAALVFSTSIGIGIRKIVNERRRRENIKKTTVISHK